MRRRAWLGLPLLLAGCGLAERPYEERREWPLEVRRPGPAAAGGGRVLLLRAMRAGPGMESRGLQVLQADGSLRTEFYEEWAVPPVQGVEEALRQWLAASGRFAAVVAPGSRLNPDLVLEAELDALLSVPARGVARVAMGVVLLEGGAPARVRLQRRVEAEARLDGTTPAAQVQAERAALALAFAEVERAVAG